MLKQIHVPFVFTGEKDRVKQSVGKKIAVSLNFIFTALWKACLRVISNTLIVAQINETLKRDKS